GLAGPRACFGASAGRHGYPALGRGDAPGRRRCARRLVPVRCVSGIGRRVQLSVVRGGLAMPLICFASPKGGVGKTTLAANIADALRRTGRRVLTLDFDPQNTLRLHYGVALNDGAGFTADLPKRPDWRNATRQTASGVLLLPHGAID